MPARRTAGTRALPRARRGTAAANRPDARPDSEGAGLLQGRADRRPARLPNSGYKGASKDMAKPASRPAQAPTANRPNTGKVKPPSSGGGDRGYAKPTSKPAQMPKPQSSSKPASRPAQMPHEPRWPERRWIEAAEAIGHVRLGWRRQGQQGRQPARQAEHAAGCPQQGRWWRRWRRRQEGQALGEAHEHHQDAIFRPALLRGSRVRRCARRMRQGRGSQLVQDAGSSGRRAGGRDTEGRRACIAEAARPGSGGPAVVGGRRAGQGRPQ